MKLLIVLASLLALCSAQTPTRPTIASTFVMNCEAELHLAEETRFGKALIARNHDKDMGIEKSTFENHGQEETEELLERNDLSKAYYIRGNAPGEHCIEEERKASLIPFWEWVEKANYEGKRTIRERQYDFWGYSFSNVRFELAVEEDNPNLPAYFNRKSAEDFVLFSVTNFNATAPASSIFSVPSACNHTRLY